MDIAAMRQLSGRQQPLLEADLAPDPIAQFEQWLAEAVASGEPEPNAMTLATVQLADDGSAAPDARMVLLKGVGPDGFVFFSNYASNKGAQLAATPAASLVFWWPSCQRQVRVHGEVRQLDAAASDAYFSSRPMASRMAAIVSQQSQVVTSRESLHAEFTQLQTAHLAGEAQIQRPAHWGGYVVMPKWIEFWQGQPSRLHDRLRYICTATTDTAEAWRVVRLAP